MSIWLHIKACVLYPLYSTANVKKTLEANVKKTLDAKRTLAYGLEFRKFKRRLNIFVFFCDVESKINSNNTNRSNNNNYTSCWEQN
jgi:hypothetical protein